MTAGPPTQEAVMGIQEVRDLFNHPLGDADLRRALSALGADPAWSLRTQEEGADRVTCVLVHRASGAAVPVDQERSVVGLWNSCI